MIKAAFKVGVLPIQGDGRVHARVIGPVGAFHMPIALIIPYHHVTEPGCDAPVRLPAYGLACDPAAYPVFSLGRERGIGRQTSQHHPQEEKGGRH